MRLREDMKAGFPMAWSGSMNQFASNADSEARS